MKGDNISYNFHDIAHDFGGDRSNHRSWSARKKYS